MQTDISKLYGIELVDNMNDMAMAELSLDDEFVVECISMMKAEHWQFTPLSRSSMEELGSLLHIIKSFKISTICHWWQMHAGKGTCRHTSY